MKTPEKHGIPTAMIPIKELGLHAKVQSLQALFVTLVSALGPIVVPGENGLEALDPRLRDSVRTSIETALIQTCNRISAFMGDGRNWEDDDSGAMDVLGMLMGQAVAEVDAKKQRAPRRKKGPENEQK